MEPFSRSPKRAALVYPYVTSIHLNGRHAMLHFPWSSHCRGDVQPDAASLRDNRLFPGVKVARRWRSADFHTSFFLKMAGHHVALVVHDLPPVINRYHHTHMVSSNDWPIKDPA